jgi:hypothetical protein
LQAENFLILERIGGFAGCKIRACSLALLGLEGLKKLSIASSKYENPLIMTENDGIMTEM